MTEAGPVVSPHRATILVGYGVFGLDVLRRLLASTAPRGVLNWEEPPGAAPSERHLQDLALLWVPDPTAADGQMDQEDAHEGSALEMMRDLYRQIQPVGGGTPSDIVFADTLSETAETLLSASGRASRRGTLPLGLDVIVLARPATREAVGTLDRLLVRGMERLANNANLQREVQGAEALNFVAIFDFKNYWDRSDSGRSVRRAVHESVEQWQKRRVSGKPAFGRFYLVDGRTDEGIREPNHRIDEISLLIEFLLFEGQRSGELQRLYQPLGRHEASVATFGIRLMERSAGFLSHLAAARFGIGWLEYLAGTSTVRVSEEPSELRQRLAPYGPEALDELLDAGALRGEIESSLSVLERELTSLPVELPDWPRRVRTRYGETARRLESQLSKRAHAKMTEIAGRHLARLPEELRIGVNTDLHHPRDPAPVGRVIAELEESLAALELIPPVETPPPGQADELMRNIEVLHSNYALFQEERVQVEGLRRWWPLQAVALASGATPVVNALLSDIPRPASMSFLADRAWTALQWINNPLVIGGLLFIVIWLLGLTLHRSIAARIDRARRFYSDPERGRFVDRLRSGMRPEGGLRAPIDAVADRLLIDIALSVRAEVSRELGRVLDRLRERHREILWLRDQLRGFLRMHGVTGEDMRPEMGRLSRNGTGIRYGMERGEDFENMLRSNPPGPERFRSTQISQAPFAGWDDRYSRAFLIPIEFLDRLSSVYKDPYQQELAQPGSGPEQKRLAEEFRDFLAQRGSFSLAFQFKAQEGVPPDQRYCLLPPAWKLLPGVMPALADLRMSDHSVLTGADSGRAYLLRLQAGVDPKCLLEPPE